MSEIRCGTEAVEFAAETLASSRNCITAVQSAISAVGNGTELALQTKNRCFEVRDRVRMMIGDAKERLVSLENLLLSESDDSARWERSRDKLNEFLKVADNNLEILDTACIYVEKALEEVNEWKKSYMQSAEDFYTESEYGVKKLCAAAEIIDKYAKLGRIGEGL